MPHTVAQPADNSWRYAEDGLVTGLSLAMPDSETHYLPVMKLSYSRRTFYTMGLESGRSIRSLP